MKNPLIPMAAITGNLSRGEIAEILRRYKEVGIEQYLMYPRDGCDVPYMSERWLEICGDFIEIGAELSIDIWLYDEFNFPSGTCRGKVMADDPRFFAKELVRTEDGAYRIVEKTDYADILDPDATDAFIKSTHEVYYQRFGKYFGSVIKGIFSDEPGMAYSCLKDGYPYSNGIENDYFAKTGRDFFADFVNSHEEFDSIYGKLLEDRFCNNFIKRIRDWCDGHGILMTGHLLAESVLSDSVWSNGNTLRALSGFSLPGMDEIFTVTAMRDAEWLTFGTVRYAISKNKNGGLCESFALGPTDILPQKEMRMLMLEAMFGVDQYVLAVSATDARGNVIKNGWYNPTNYVNPWFEGFRFFGERAKEAAAFARKEPAFDVAVEIPYSKMQKFLHKEPEKAEKISKNANRLLVGLTERQLVWKLIDEGEKTALPVLRFDENTDVEALINVPSGAVKVCEKDGKPAKDVFVQRYQSGEIVVIELGDSLEDRELVFVNGGRSYDFTLSGMNYTVLSANRPPVPAKHRTVLDPGENIAFKLSLDRPNTLRPNIKSSATSFEFFAECKLENVTLLRRNYVYDGSVSLDGQKLEFTEKTQYPAFGIAQLYLAAKPVTLRRGKHVISVSESAQSEPYLPSVFVLGSFSSRCVDGIDTLGKLPETVKCGRLDTGKYEILPQFAGKISYEASVKIPACRTLALDSCGLYTKLFINDEFVGERFDTRTFDIPSKFSGRECRIRIEQYTTIGPLFGRTDCIEQGNGAPWTPITDWFPGKYEKCGILSLAFCE